jgi:hypothetical protein
VYINQGFSIGLGWVQPIYEKIEKQCFLILKKIKRSLKDKYLKKNFFVSLKTKKGPKDKFLRFCSSLRKLKE